MIAFYEDNQKNSDLISRGRSFARSLVNQVISDLSPKGIMEKCRAEIESTDAQMTEISDEIEKICTRRDDILEIITGAASEQFKAELKELNGREPELKGELEQLQIKKESVQLGIKKAVTARGFS